MRKIFKGERQMRKKNFTILELLMVIAIMIILITTLLPALSKAKSSVQRIHCIGNLKQIGLGVSSYSSDFNNLILLNYTSGSSVEYWNQALWENDYLPANLQGNSREVSGNFLMLCPATPNHYFGPLFSYGCRSIEKTIPSSYFMALDTSTPNNLCFLLPGRIRNPSGYLHLGDTVFSNSASPAERIGRQYFRWSYAGTNGAAAHMRHNNYSANWFLDGHAGTLNPLQTATAIGKDFEDDPADTTTSLAILSGMKYVPMSGLNMMGL